MQYLTYVDALAVPVQQFRWSRTISSPPLGQWLTYKSIFTSPYQIWFTKIV